MAIVRKVITADTELTEEQIKRLDEAAKRPIQYDEDNPPLTAEQLKHMAIAAKEQRANRVKQVVAIRITPETLEKAKATGKGYTGFLSRLLDEAINDAEMVKRCL